MAKKMIEPEKSWFVKEPAKIEEILEAAGLFVNNELLVKAIYCDINRIFSLKNYSDSFIRKSVIVNHYSKRRRYKIKLLDTVLDNKWLFYKQEIEMSTDTLIQPVFDMTKMTERKINKLINAITNNDYARLQKLAPNEVNRFDIYSNCLLKEEPGGSLDVNLHVTNVPSTPARDGSELIPENEHEKNAIDCQRTVNSLSTDCQCVDNALSTHCLARIEDTRVAIESREKREGDKRFSQSKEENRTLLGETESGLLSCSDKKTDFETDKAGTFEEYVNGLKLESKEVESLFDFAGDEAEYLRANFDKFKLKLINRSKLLGKDKELDDLSHYRKNLYLYNLLRNPAFRNELINQIKQIQTFKIQNDFRHQREGFKWDLFNKDGDRMSGGRIIPRDAPPQPSPDHCWDFDSGKWCI